MASKLKPIYTIVAREMALGIDLKDICEARSLNYATLQRVARGDIFQQEIKRLQGEIEEQMVEQAIDDPVLKKLHALSYRAVGVLQEEMENHDPEDGATASSRIAATRAVLDRSGYSGKTDTGEGAKIVIMLSETKLNAVKKASQVTEQLMKDVPDIVDGHLQE